METFVGTAILIVAAIVQLVKYVIPATVRDHAIIKLLIFGSVMMFSYVAAGIIGTWLIVPPLDFISIEVLDMAKNIFLGAVALYDGGKIFYRIGKEYR